MILAQELAYFQRSRSVFPNRAHTDSRIGSSMSCEDIYLPSPSTMSWMVNYLTSIFKWSKGSLNSEFSFSKTGCLTKAEEFALLYDLLTAEERTIGSSMKWKANSLVQDFELWLLVSFPVMITVMLSVPPCEAVMTKIISQVGIYVIQKISYPQFIMIMSLSLTTAEYTNTKCKNSVAETTWSWSIHK